MTDLDSDHAPPFSNNAFLGGRNSTFGKFSLKPSKNFRLFYPNREKFGTQESSKSCRAIITQWSSCRCFANLVPKAWHAVGKQKTSIPFRHSCPHSARSIHFDCTKDRDIWPSTHTVFVLHFSQSGLTMCPSSWTSAVRASQRSRSLAQIKWIAGFGEEYAFLLDKVNIGTFEPRKPAGSRLFVREIKLQVLKRGPFNSFMELKRSHQQYSIRFPDAICGSKHLYLKMISQCCIFLFQNCLEKIDTCASMDIIFVLYSITDRSSFQEATLIVKYLNETKNIPSSAIFLIASKADQKRHTAVTEFEGKLFAVNTGCSFHQLSNSEGFSEHKKIIKQAYLIVSLGSVQKAPKSPLMRRFKGKNKTKGQTAPPGPRTRSGSVEF